MDKNRDFDEQFAPMPLITDSTSPLPDKNDSTASSESEIADTAPLSRKTSKCKKRAFFNIIIVLVVSASISTVFIPLFTKDDKYKLSSPSAPPHELVGSVILFGGYPWYVLDVQDNKALIITENILELRPYHNVDRPVTWEDCSLRRYLNDTFYNSFNEQDKNCILETEIDNGQSIYYDSSFVTVGGNNTTDHIFLLSYDEFKKYTKTVGNLKARCRFANGNWMNEWLEWVQWLDEHSSKDRYYEDAYIFNITAASLIGLNGEAGAWWLRTPRVEDDGDITHDAYAVLDETAYTVRMLGYTFFEDLGGKMTYIDGPYAGVRPALWLDLNQYDISLSTKPSQSSNSINEDIFIDIGLTYGEISGKYGKVTASDFYDGGRYFIFEEGPPVMYFFRNPDGSYFQEIDFQKTPDDAAICQVLRTTAGIFFSNLEDIQLLDVIEQDIGAVIERERDEMDGGYRCHFIYRNYNIYMGTDDENTITPSSSIRITLVE